MSFSVNGTKSSFIEINGEKIEIINKGYVESLEANLHDTKRDVRTLQARNAQLIRSINGLLADVSDLRRQLKARDRFD